MQTAMHGGMCNAQSGPLSRSCAADLPLPERRRLCAIFPDRCSRKRRGCIYTASRLSILTARARALQPGGLSWVVNVQSSQPPGAAGGHQRVQAQCMAPGAVGALLLPSHHQGRGQGKWWGRGWGHGSKKGSGEGLQPAAHSGSFFQDKREVFPTYQKVVT